MNELVKEMHVITKNIAKNSSAIHSLEYATREFDLLSARKKEMKGDPFWYRAADMYYNGMVHEGDMDQQSY